MPDTRHIEEKVESYPDLKEHHLETLRYIIEHIEKYGFQPSYREIAEHFGVTKTAIVGRLRVLEAAGVVNLPKNKERAITIRHLRWESVPVET